MKPIEEGTIGWTRPEGIYVPPKRDRQLFRPEAHAELVESIRKTGIISPPVVDIDSKAQMTLIAGERRLRACKEILSGGGTIRVAGTEVTEPGCLPVLVLSEQPESVRKLIELEENVRRLDLTWQERVRATAALAEMMRISSDSTEMPTASAIAERAGIAKVSAVSSRLTVAQYLDRPEIAGAPSEEEAKKRVAKLLENELLGYMALEALKSDVQRPDAPASRHTLLEGEAAVVLAGLATRFDVILTDPPYGVGADKYKHDGSISVLHKYDDSARAVTAMLLWLPGALTRVAKDQCHLYLFCDIQWWMKWREAFAALGWEVCNRPLIWSKGRGPTGSADCWPMHTYECILYAVRGRKPTQGVTAPDVLTYPPVSERVHAAQKPVALYEDLLRRSVLFNDRVLDAFCGSGTIFEAADRLNCVATGIDRDIRLAQRRLAGEKEGGE